MFLKVYTGLGYPSRKEIEAEALKKGYTHSFYASDELRGFSGVYNGATIVVYDSTEGMSEGEKQDAENYGTPIGKYEIADEFCHIGCGSCKYHQVDADRRQDTTCKRLDHKHIQFAVPWFKSYDCGQRSGITCADFEPEEYCKWLYHHWTSMQDYVESFERVEKREYLNGYLGLCLDGNQDIVYYVDRGDFFNNTFLNEDGSLKWHHKHYYKRTNKNAIGYVLVTEYNEESTT